MLSEVIVFSSLCFFSILYSSAGFLLPKCLQRYDITPACAYFVVSFFEHLEFAQPFCRDVFACEICLYSICAWRDSEDAVFTQCFPMPAHVLFLVGICRKNLEEDVTVLQGSTIDSLVAKGFHKPFADVYDFGYQVIAACVALVGKFF